MPEIDHIEVEYSEIDMAFLQALELSGGKMSRKRMFRWVLLCSISLFLGLLYTNSWAQSSGSRINILEFALASSLTDGRAASPTTSFSRANDRWIYCVVRIENRTHRETALYVSFERADEDLFPGRRGIRLEIPDRRFYRTVARADPSDRDAGQYRVVIRDERGRILRHDPFTIAE